MWQTTVTTPRGAASDQAYALPLEAAQHARAPQRRGGRTRGGCAATGPTAAALERPGHGAVACVGRACAAQRPRHPRPHRAVDRARDRRMAGVSLVLFLLSAQIEQGKVSDEAKVGARLGRLCRRVGQHGPDPRLRRAPARARSRARTPAAPAARTRSCCGALVAAHAARLSIPRDTVVEIPGPRPPEDRRRLRVGGAALSIHTIEQYLGDPDQICSRSTSRTSRSSSMRSAAST